MNDLSRDAALVADVMAIVRARFVEACHTLSHVDVRNLAPAVARSFWPAIPTQVDQDYRSPYRPSAAAISRAEEVLQGWLLDYVPEEEHRVLVIRWAGSLATPKRTGSFRSFCQESGRSRTTADRHLFVAFQRIASGLLKNAKSLHQPEWSRVVPLMPKSSIEFDKVAERVAERMLRRDEHGPSYWRDDVAKGADRPELRNMTWAEERNERRRRRLEQEARERDEAA